jgi:hypothetical protein
MQPRKDPFHLSSLSPRSHQFQQSAEATHSLSGWENIKKVENLLKGESSLLFARIIRKNGAAKKAIFHQNDKKKMGIH